jgi:phytanoyl-CoA hydroxylase
MVSLCSNERWRAEREHGVHKAQDGAEQGSALAATFARQGFAVIPGFWTRAQCAAAEAEIRQALDPVLGPAEFEADVGYPGAPSDRAAPGGDTPRRLLFAYSRFPALRGLAASPLLAQHLRTLLATDDVRLSQCHHNCVMTKAPGFSSATLWHQDVRYWSYARPALISAWLALGSETVHNGALRVIPGTHLEDFAASRLDEQKFLIPDQPTNAALIDSAVSVELAPGDLLLLHCRLFHAAGRNASQSMKLSPVFTYRSADNLPQSGTRSAVYPDIAL